MVRQIFQIFITDVPLTGVLRSEGLGPVSMDRSVAKWGVLAHCASYFLKTHFTARDEHRAPRNEATDESDRDP